jgi:hypothetical protein
MTSQRTPRRTVGLVGAAAVLAVAVLTACSTTTDTSDTSRAGAGQASDDRPGRDGAGAERTTPVPDRHEPSNGNEGTAEESTMQIEMRVGDERFTATVDDTPAGRDLLAQLPQTIQMRDHGGVEKTGPLHTPLSLDGQPDGADPDVGDLGYYAPGNNLVFYYGDQGYYRGIVILGRLDDAATSRLAAIAGDITATVTANDAS